MNQNENGHQISGSANEKQEHKKSLMNMNDKEFIEYLHVLEEDNDFRSEIPDDFYDIVLENLDMQIKQLEERIEQYNRTIDYLLNKKITYKDVLSEIIYTINGVNKEVYQDEIWTLENLEISLFYAKQIRKFIQIVRGKLHHKSFRGFDIHTLSSMFSEYLLYHKNRMQKKAR